MTRVISAPPPEVITQLTELIALVLNADAVAKVVENLKAASDDYHHAKLEYETSIGLAARAKQDLEAAKAAADPIIAKAAADTAEVDEKLVRVSKGESDLKAALDDLSRRVADFEMQRAQALADIADKQAAVDAALNNAKEAEVEARAIKSKLAEKLALIQSA